MRAVALQTSKSVRRRVTGGRGAPSPRRSIEQVSLFALFGLLILSAAVVGWFSGLVNTRSARYDEPPAPPTINDYRNGAIMFVPTRGADCDVYRFDNLTGGVAFNGTVNCERKLNPENEDAYRPGTERAARMKAVLDGFKK